MVWTFEQTQALENFSVYTPVRMTVIRLKSGGLWVHAPVAPTGGAGIIGMVVGQAKALRWAGERDIAGGWGDGRTHASSVGVECACLLSSIVWQCPRLPPLATPFALPPLFPPGGTLRPCRLCPIQLAPSPPLLLLPLHADECVRLVKELGEVEFIVLGTFAYEHKAFVGPFSRRFPKAKVCPGLWAVVHTHTSMRGRAGHALMPEED
jgi:hypothetical protein